MKQQATYKILQSGTARQVFALIKLAARENPQKTIKDLK